MKINEITRKMHSCLRTSVYLEVESLTGKKGKTMLREK
ncbi:hypothetical protein LACDD01_02061 [Lactococcus sp. DD01]|nr:hypothetical protein LACDD01_02061 [Lactococcus sp. DD01]